MITFADTDDGYDVCFGETDLEPYDIDEVVDFYAKMGPPDPGYMAEVRRKYLYKS